MSEETPEQKVDAASIDTADKPAPKGRPQYPFPRRTIEDSLRVPTTIKTHNGGEPYDPQEIAKVLGIGGKTGNFFYLTSASANYGFTSGTRDAPEISLEPLGRQVAYAGSDEEAQAAKMKAFLNVEKFKGVLEHYKGSKLPEGEFVSNTLEGKFGLDPRVHEDFLDVFQKNCRYLGIGATWTPGQHGTTLGANGAGGGATVISELGAPPAPLGESGNRPVCFVAMPFTEKTEAFAPGFFNEVFASLLAPAIEAAGFEARTAKGQGSDLIHSTIVNGLLDADLVLVDLTEHNPNVLFELGLRIAEKRPIVLVKAIGTNPIFDVDQLLRVVSYDPSLWPSTLKDDLPKLTTFIKGAWATRDSERPYMEILRQQPVAAI